jgi:hypothetical protein
MIVVLNLAVISEQINSAAAGAMRALNLRTKVDIASM